MQPTLRGHYIVCYTATQGFSTSVLLFGFFLFKISHTVCFFSCLKTFIGFLEPRIYKLPA